MEAFRAQTFRPRHLLIIDSGSQDKTVELALAHGFEVRRIPREDFDHGRTRQLGTEILKEADLLIYMTQDAILAHPEALERLVETFGDSTVGVAYGRQLPRPGADPIESHARLFNYPSRSELRSQWDIASKGLKAAFNSDSFSCYRRSALEQIGGFPNRVILGEDVYVAAKMLLAGWRVAYVAEAQVYHSHSYTLGQEFKRYFDIGVFHARERWIIEALGKAEGEGLRFLCSEMTYLRQKAPLKIPSALLRTLLKYAAYRMGCLEHRMPQRLKRYLTMHKAFFTHERR